MFGLKRLRVFFYLPLLFLLLAGCAVLGPDNDRGSGGGWGRPSGSSGLPRFSLYPSPGNTAGSAWLGQVMDQYHSNFAVYLDADSAGNHFFVKGKIGDAQLTMSESETNAPHSGKTCIRITLDPSEGGTGFFYTSTKSDGHPNNQVFAVNSESIPLLALDGVLSNYHTNSLTFAEVNNQSGSYGFDFNTDKDGKWYEGSISMAMGYLKKGFTSKAGSTISTINGGEAADGGMYAANMNLLTTGYEWSAGNPLYLYKREHAGTTALKLLLDKRKNPYWYGSGSDSLPGTPAGGATAGYTYLTNAQDQYHRSYDVYTEHDSPGNHFNCYAKIGQDIPEGMGDMDLDSSQYYNEDNTPIAHSGENCIRYFLPWPDTPWAGFVFLNGVLSNTMTAPGQNWGEVPNAGVDLSGATELSFYAMGHFGGEQVTFFCGGVGWDENGNPDTNKPYRDSFPKVSTNVILGQSWTKITLDLTGKNLTNVIGGFGFVVVARTNGSPSCIYIDDIQYNKSRLSSPRLIASYKTSYTNSYATFDRVMRQNANTYDNALALLAFLASGDNTRAGYIADYFVYAATNDRWYGDYRLRNAYAAGDMTLPNGWKPNNNANVTRLPCWADTNCYEDSYAVGTSANTMAWAMLALLGYYQTVGGDQYLNTAKNLGDWVEDNLRASGGGYYSGYTGWEPNAVKDTSKVVEHNSALYTAFSRLYGIAPSESKWNTRANWAKDYVLSMWNVSSGFVFMNGVMNTSATNYDPAANWGDSSGAGVDLSGATTLKFWAKGQNGGENVEFYCAGIGRDPNTGAATKSHPDSSAKISLGTVSLGTSWQEYTIDLSGKDLSYVLGGFGYNLAASGDSPVTIYVDDIQYDKQRLSEPRLLASYKTIASTNAFDMSMENVAYVYDNAMAILAFLAVGENERAGLVADALIYAKDHDRSYSDGRLRNAYKAGDITVPPGWIIGGKTATTPLPGFWDTVSNVYREDLFNVSSDTGNQAWAMLAWIACYQMIGSQKYLDAATNVGTFVYNNLYDSGGIPGYRGQYKGWEPAVLQTYKSTEHNLDLYAAFRRLYDITSDTNWLIRATYASNFCMAMWDDTAGCFYSGTRSDGSTIAHGTWEEVIPTDAQPWMLLAFRTLDTKYYRGLDFNESNSQYSGSWGFDFDCYDSAQPSKPGFREGIWYEGTAQMGTAYMLTGQESKASSVSNTISSGRAASGASYAADGPNDHIFTGFILENGDWNYYHRESVAATAWGVMVDKRINAFWLGTNDGVIDVAKVYTNYGIYSESHTNGGKVVFDSTAAISTWNGISLSENSSYASEGSTGFNGAIWANDWWGWGVYPINPAEKDMTSYADGWLCCSVKSSSGSINIKVGIKSGSSTEKWVNITNYGFSADGQWHAVAVPMSSFPGISFTNITYYFMMASDASSSSGNSFQLDDIYWKK